MHDPSVYKAPSPIIGSGAGPLRLAARCFSAFGMSRFLIVGTTFHALEGQGLRR